MSEYLNRAGAALAGAVIAIIGVFGPWATADLGIFSQSRQGINTEDGKVFIVLVLIAAAGTVVARSRKVWGLLAIPGLLALATAIYDFIDIIGTEGGEFFGNSVSLAPGWGMYACVIGTVILVGACIYKATRRSEVQPEEPVAAA